jgi:8-oxo-dGTP diphosphatase
MNKKIEKFHLGIYAIIKLEDKILLVKKSRGPYRGTWDLPGGKPIAGESIFQTLQREVKEETGIKLIEMMPYENHAFSVEYVDGRKSILLHHTCLIYRATQFDMSEMQENINEKDVAGCAWISKSELSQIPLSKVTLCVV